MVERIAGALKVLLKGTDPDANKGRRTQDSLVTRADFQKHEDFDTSRFQISDQTATNRHTETLDRINSVKTELAELGGYIKGKLG